MDPQAFVFLGRSGCGKGTQAKLLADFLKAKGRKVIYVETGHAFRELAQNDSLVGRNIRDILEQGLLIPVFLPIWIWTRIIVENFSGQEDMIMDGVCRRHAEAVALDSLFDFYKIKKPSIVVMNVSRDWSFTRLVERKRPDDTPEEIQNRLDWYERDVVPSINYFRENPKYNFIEIKGEQPIEEVHKDIIKALKL